MPIHIEDGTGQGYIAKVDDNNHLNTHSVTENECHFISDEKGYTFSWSNVSYDYDAGDTILLVRNDDTDRHLHICYIDISGDTNTEVVIHCPDNITPAGTTVTAVNLNRMSGNTANATAKADENTNSQGNIIWRGRILANTVKRVTFDACVILGYHDSIAIDFVTNGGAADVDIIGYFDKHD